MKSDALSNISLTLSNFVIIKFHHVLLKSLITCLTISFNVFIIVQLFFIFFFFNCMSLCVCFVLVFVIFMMGFKRNKCAKYRLHRFIWKHFEKKSVFVLYLIKMYKARNYSLFKIQIFGQLIVIWTKGFFKLSFFFPLRVCQEFYLCVVFYFLIFFCLSYSNAF